MSDVIIRDTDWDELIETLSPDISSCLTYSKVDQNSRPPYNCSCTEKSFPTRQKFQRHMKKHNILVPFKTMKRKADELDSDLVTKDFTR